jgi:hypothetical protein
MTPVWRALMACLVFADTANVIAQQAATKIDSSSVLQVSFAETDDRVDVMLGGDVFTRFVKRGYDKPILYPIYGPGQIGMTRNWPMQEGVVGEAHDHPHHKSMWFAHVVNDIDFWTEADGSIVVESVELDADHSRLISKSNWLRKEDGSVVCTDSTIFQFGGDDASRWIDATITVSASHGDLTFLDTKEGTFALRTHPDLRLSSNPKDGVLKVWGSAVNSNGDVGKSIWGKAAKWVLYSGPIDGTPMSIAIFDHPENIRHPTTWHARDYGLVAANPFGLHDFLNEKMGSGEYKISQGDSLTLRYRAVFIQGIAAAADIEPRYECFVTDLK